MTGHTCPPPSSCLQPEGGREGEWREGAGGREEEGGGGRKGGGKGREGEGKGGRGGEEGREESEAVAGTREGKRGRES